MTDRANARTGRPWPAACGRALARAPRRVLPCAALALLPLPVRADAPMSLLRAFGSPGDQVLPLTRALLALAIAVVVIIAAAVLLAIALRARRGVALARDQGAVRRTSHRAAMAWVYGALGATTLILLGFTAWTVETLSAIAAPDTAGTVTVEVTGRQWWWEFRYSDGTPSRSFVTANEIHIPVGQPVRFVLRSGDVIHSFWVPALGGKTDLIPGQDNTMWLQAQAPGEYRGQCVEYCGLQHANMALRVFAEPPADFAAWWDGQLAPAPAPAAGLAEAGERLFLANCGACHSVRGTIAHGAAGPDLTHLASRSSIAALARPNTPEALAEWLADPDAVKPGTLMPDPGLPPPQIEAVVAYLGTLQ